MGTECQLFLLKILRFENLETSWDMRNLCARGSRLNSVVVDVFQTISVYEFVFKNAFYNAWTQEFFNNCFL
jgi:hypothetical protein